MLSSRAPALVAVFAASIFFTACGGKTLADRTSLGTGGSATSATDAGEDGAASEDGAVSGSSACTLGPLPTSTAPGAPSGPPGESSSGRCSLLGTWDFTNDQQGGDAPNEGSVLFRADGDWFGGDYQKDVCATEFMYGLFSFDGTTLAFPNDSAMGPICNAGNPATWSVTFNADCSNAALQVHLDDCTGARLYLEDATVLVRRQ